MNAKKIKPKYIADTNDSDRGWIICCPKCNKKVSIYPWNYDGVECECGISWNIKVKVEAIGKIVKAKKERKS